MCTLRLDWVMEFQGNQNKSRINRRLKFFNCGLAHNSVLFQIKKEMANIQRRTTKLSGKSLQLKAARDKIVETERQQAAKLANLEARVVTTTPTPGSSSSGSGKLAVVRD